MGKEAEKMMDHTAELSGKMILADQVAFSLDDFQTGLNNNVVVIGSPGSGKTRGLVIPNLLNCTGSYVISDPKGNLHDKYKDYLEGSGYEVRLIDLIRPERSDHYNPFHYIHDERDIIRIANLLMMSAEQRSRTLDPFWDNSATILLSAYIAFMHEYMPREDQTLNTLLWMLENSRMDDSDDHYRTIMDEKMDDIEKLQSDAFAVRQYRKVRTASARTWNSVLISAIANFGTADFDSIKEMMITNDFEFKEIGQKKTALFVVVSDTDRSMDFLAGLLFTQIMQELCLYADTACDSCRLPVPVRFLLDDFATNCKIGDFPKMIASFRSRGISAMLMLQAESQLRQLYDEDAMTILGSCDTYCYLGGNDVSTAGNVALRANKMLQSILEMPVGRLWIFRRGEKPVYAKSFLPEAYERACMKKSAEKRKGKENLIFA